MLKSIKKKKVKIEKKIEEEKNIELESTRGQKWWYSHSNKSLSVIHTNTFLQKKSSL